MLQSSKVAVPITPPADKKVKSKHKIYLDTLPPEIILFIFEYLEPQFVLKTMSCVCRKFYNLLSNDSTWRLRVMSHWERYPLVAHEDFNWKKACISLEKESKLWRKNAVGMKHFSLSGIMTSDAVLFIQEGRICVTGSRDRSIKFWNVAKLTNESPKNTADYLLDSITNAHNGWIWTVKSSKHVLCSGSWDTYIRLWDLEVGCKLTCAAKCKGAVLCCDIEETTLVAGTYHKELVMYDIRQKLIPIAEFDHHSKAILDVKLDDNYMISTSEDCTLAIFDLRYSRVMKMIECPNFILNLSYGENLLIGGDKQGQLYIWNTADGLFEFVKVLNVGHGNKITGVHHTVSTVITASTDKKLNVSYLSLAPQIWYSVDMPGEVCALDFYHRNVACTSANTLSIWKPKF